VRVWMVRPAALQRIPRLQMRAEIDVAAMIHPGDAISGRSNVHYGKGLSAAM
jgi:hypothetical protein